MSRAPRSARRRLAWLALVVVAMPLLMAGLRVVTHFAADFSEEGYQSTFFAEGGVLKTVGPDDIFEQGVDTEGDGVLHVLPNATGSWATLVADLDAPAKGGHLNFDFDLATQGEWSSLGIWLNDADGGGMIDITCERPDPGETPIRVAGLPVPLPEMLPGDTRLHVRLTLRQPMIGLPTWTVRLTSSEDSSELTGPLYTGGETPSIGSILFVRPPLSLEGAYELDDVIVSSTSSGGLISSNL